MNASEIARRLAALPALHQDYSSADMAELATLHRSAARFVRAHSSTPTPRPTDQHYTEKEGYAIAKARARGRCEAGTPWCDGKARETHHKAGRGFAECHHPDLLLRVCGRGNYSGCHAWIGRHREEAVEAGWRIDRNSVHFAAVIAALPPKVA